MVFEINKIFEIVIMCVEELNKQLPPEKRIAADENTIIVGTEILKIVNEMQITKNS